MPILGKKKKQSQSPEEDDLDLDGLQQPAEENDSEEEGKKNKKNKKEKKEKKDKKNKEKKKGGKLKFFFSFLFIFLVFGGIIFGIFYYNIFNIRDGYLRPVFEQIPIVNNLLPPLTPEPPAPDVSALQLRIAELEAQIEAWEKENSSLEKDNSALLGEINRLREYEDTQLAYREEKLAFDRMIATEDPSAYENFYSQISPENAEIIYREVVGIVVNQKELSSYISTYQNMDESAAAKIFEEMMGTELDLVVTILRNLKTEQRTLIMENMKATNAAIITKRMSPGL